MLDGDVQEFVDGLYYGGERSFVYQDMEFFIDAFGTDELFCIKIELFVPWFGDTYWEFVSNDNTECVKKFLEAKIFHEKTFWEVEKEITWIDDDSSDAILETENYYKKYPENKSYIEQLKKERRPTKLSDLSQKEQERAIKLNYATLKDGELYDKNGNIALALDYAYWFFKHEREEKLKK